MMEVVQQIAFERYPVYKDSGVEWLGEIPESWDSLANKYIFNLKKNLVGKKSADYVLLSLSLRGIIQRILEDGGKFPAEFDTYQEVKKGDFIFCLFDVEETPRCIGLSDFEGMITGAYTVMSVHPNFDKRFLYYFYLNLDADKRMRPLYTGLRNTISKDNFFAFKTFIPPLPEQTAIANFLDEKTARIDQAIAQKEQLIALLKERKQIMIQELVTGKKVWNGTTWAPPEKTKDSGVEWIGEIPQDWDVRRSKFLFTQRKERAREKDIQLSATQKYGVISQERYEELSGKTVVKLQFHLEKRKHVEIDDFIISMRSFQGGLERAWEDGCIRSSYVVLKPSDEIDPNYFAYLLKSDRYIEALQSTAGFIRDGQDLTFDNFSKVDLILPPKMDQNRISKEIDLSKTRIDQSISLQEKQIEKLKEYKSTLIDSAVTGKVKVL